jgi:hemerythrin superfamily protein
MRQEGMFSARGLAMFAGGASVALIASRLMPPIVAQAFAVRDGGDPFAALVEDHRRFLHILGQMEEVQGSSLLHRTQLFLRLKRGLAAHALAEEDVVYPLLSDAAGAETDAQRLYAEHGQIKTHLYALEQMIDDEMAWARRAGQLRALIAEHGRDEEETEFPRLRQLLDEQAMARLSRHVRREKAMLL